MNKRIYRSNVFIGFAASAIIVLVGSVMSYNAINNLLTGQRWVAHTDSVITGLGRIMSKMKDAETGQRGYLLTGEDIFLEPYNHAEEEVWRIMQQVRVMTIDNELQQKDLPVLNMLIEEKFNILKRHISIKRSGQPVSVEMLETGKNKMDEIRALTKGMEERENALLTARTAKFSRLSGTAQVMIVITTILSICLTILFYIKIKKDYLQKQDLSKQLVAKQEQLNEQIDEIAKTAEAIANGNYGHRSGSKPNE